MNQLVVRSARNRRSILLRRSCFLGVLFSALAASALAQNISLPQRMADAAIQRWPDGRIAAPASSFARSRELGTLLNGMDAVWYNTANGEYYRYIQQSIDPLIQPDGSISAPDVKANPLDNLLLGSQLLLLYRVTFNPKYYKAAKLLHDQFAAQLQTSGESSQNGPVLTELAARTFAQPFYAEYASVFQQSSDFAEIAKQFTRIEQAPHTSSESRTLRTGEYLMALVDTLPYYPENDPERATLLSLLNRTAATAVHHQDAAGGLQRETSDISAACMLTYALQKGVRLGYLPARDSAAAAHAWKAIQERISPSAADDDPEKVGLLLLAASEMELAPDASLGRGDKVIVDAWFNSQTKKNAAGQTISFHYKWDDNTNDGFAFFGHIWRSYGVSTGTLYTAPTLEKLKDAQFYVISSPDIPIKNPSPHYMQPEDATQIASWVKQGGVLVMMENDAANADIAHLDELADRFGIHFTTELAHHVIGDQIQSGIIPVKSGGELFHQPHTLYMKDTCTIQVSDQAKPLLEDRGTIAMAVAKYGKGTVYAVVDPWLYNEYTDGRKLSQQYDNFSAGKELVRWLLQQLPQSRKPPSRMSTR